MEGLLLLSKRPPVTLHAVHLGPSRDNVQPVGNTHLCCGRTQNEAALRRIFASGHLIEGIAFCRPLCLDLDPASISNFEYEHCTIPTDCNSKSKYDKIPIWCRIVVPPQNRSDKTARAPRQVFSDTAHLVSTGEKRILPILC